MAERKERAAPLEWAAAVVGLLIFFGLFGTIFMQGLRNDDAAPNLVIEGQNMVPAPGGTLVQFTIHNRSARTAAAVTVEGRVDGVSAPSQVTIDYVPAHSRVSAGLMFPGDLRGRRTEIRPIGFRRP